VVDALLEAMFPPVQQWERAENELAVAWARAALGKERFAGAWTEGRAMTLEQAIAYALDETNPESSSQ
jgi:hypothetical protein